MEEPQIRAASTEDVPAIADIVDQAYRHYIARIGRPPGPMLEMGRLDDAREIVERLRAITPLVVHRVVPLRNAKHRELLLSGLRLAAGEEA